MGSTFLLKRVSLLNCSRLLRKRNCAQARGFSIGVNEYIEMQWACARARKPREAYGLFQVMLEQGCELRLESYNALLCAYEKTAQWEDALRTFVWIDHGL